MSLTYYIREFAALKPEHFQEPRRPETVRRSLDGLLCVVAFEPGTEPEGWNDGMEQNAINQLLTAPESESVWYANEF